MPFFVHLVDLSQWRRYAAGARVGTPTCAFRATRARARSLVERAPSCARLGTIAHDLSAAWKRTVGAATRRGSGLRATIMLCSARQRLAAAFGANRRLRGRPSTCTESDQRRHDGGVHLPPLLSLQRPRAAPQRPAHIPPCQSRVGRGGAPEARAQARSCPQGQRGHGRRLRRDGTRLTLVGAGLEAAPTPAPLPEVRVAAWQPWFAGNADHACWSTPTNSLCCHGCHPPTRRARGGGSHHGTPANIVAMAACALWYSGEDGHDTPAIASARGSVSSVFSFSGRRPLPRRDRGIGARWRGPAPADAGRWPPSKQCSVSI